MLWRPRALLLDFGGVLVEPDSAPAAPEGFVAMLHELVDRAVPPELIEVDLEAGARAYSHWRDATARWYAPPEITHAQFWSDFVCADWPDLARAAVVERATDLAFAWTELGAEWRLRDGVAELLDAAHSADLPMAVVSNTLCGAAFRDFLVRSGVSDVFAAQLYSDEAGVRKPNPALVRAATDALGVEPAQVWFVGDTPLRDILAARRAGVGLAVLVRSGRKVHSGEPWAVPDITVESMVDVHAMLSEVLEGLADGQG
jgi:HAD superfamily hydrolase (TIGR01549 family)